MKILVAIQFILLTSFTLSSQSILGTWKAADDEGTTAYTYIKIYDAGDEVKGEIVEIFNGTSDLCIKCKGDKKNKPLLGMDLLWGMKKDSETEMSGGSIVDPRSGKEYGCKLELIDSNNLKVRGFLGFSLFGKSQVWTRVE